MKTKKRRLLLDDTEAYLRVLQRAMHLEEWTIEVSEEEADENTNANISYHTQRYLATLRVSTGHLLASPAQRRSTLVHELIHLLLVRYEVAAEACPAYDKPRLNIENELLTDRLAALLAPAMPLPAVAGA